MPLDITGFTGSVQARNPRLLPDGVGTNMVDAEPGFGDLRPLRERRTVATVPSVPQRISIWRMGRDSMAEALYWLSSTKRVSYTLGFGSDATERTYYTGDGTPKWTSNAIGLGAPPYPAASRELAVPAPLTAVLATITADGTGSAKERFYVQTFRNELGWESAPSPVSAALMAKQGAQVSLQLGTAPSGSYGLTARRIYRTQPDNNDNAEFFLLREVPIGTTTTTDDARALGGLLETDGWIPPPADAHSITALWNGMFSVLAGKNVHFSPPGVPYAYPVRYDKQLRDTAVASAKWAQKYLVLTTGTPVLFQGQDPEGIVDEPARLGNACVAARGVVAFPHGVVWPSNEGLAYYGDNGEALVTNDPRVAVLLTPEQWRALQPETMVAGRWGRFYVCSYGTGAARRGFMLDPLNPAFGITYLSAGFDAAHYDELHDALYVLEGGDIRRFAGGTLRLPAGFDSKHHMQPAPLNYGYAKVLASGYPLTLTVHARWMDRDGTLRESIQIRNVVSDAAFKLADGFTADNWQVRLTTSHDVQAVRLGTSLRSFKGG